MGILEGKSRYYNKKRFGGNRYLVLERDRYKCCICGKESTTVHHKDRNVSNNKMENLITLCWGCHHKEHMKENTIRRAWNTILWYRKIGYSDDKIRESSNNKYVDTLLKYDTQAYLTIIEKVSII